MFCQRLVVSAEGPFTTVCIITCPPQTAESQQSVQTLLQKTPPLSEFLVAYWPIPNRDLTLTSSVILLTVVSSLLTEARLYEFSRHLEYYLWYTLANSPISFWNRLNPTFTIAGNFFWHPTSAIGTTVPPNTEIWSVSGAICKIVDIFWRLEDAGTRQNQINFIFWIWKLATLQVTWNVFLTITQGND